MIEASSAASTAAEVPDAAKLLEVQGLSVTFADGDRRVRAVRGVSYELGVGQTLAIIGESGSGKSVSCLAMLGLLPADNVDVGGSVRLRGEEVLGRPERQMNSLRGPVMGYVFQDPMIALNPSMRVGAQIGEMFRVHRGATRKEARREAIEILGRVGIPRPDERASAYPHEFSGGMRQRVMIAMAVALRPELLIADEPTTALDVTIQAQILELLKAIQADTSMGIVFITHDLALAAETADTIAVMYAGRIVEHGSAQQVYEHPRHPYTAALLGSRPGVRRGGQRLAPIPGQAPDGTVEAAGCPFQPRCRHADALCAEAEPVERLVQEPAHLVRCHHSEQLDAAGR